MLFLTKIRIKENSNSSFCKKEPEKLIHLFWSCPKTALFWESIITRLKLCQIIPGSYSADITVSLGLRSDSSKLQRQINVCFLICQALYLALPNNRIYTSIGRISQIPKDNLQHTSTSRSKQFSTQTMVIPTRYHVETIVSTIALFPTPLIFSMSFIR